MNSYVELFLDCLAWSELIFLSERYELICELDQYENLKIDPIYRSGGNIFFFERGAQHGFIAYWWWWPGSVVEN